MHSVCVCVRMYCLVFCMHFVCVCCIHSVCSPKGGGWSVGRGAVGGRAGLCFWIHSLHTLLETCLLQLEETGNCEWVDCFCSVYTSRKLNN